MQVSTLCELLGETEARHSERFSEDEQLGRMTVTEARVRVRDGPPLGSRDFYLPAEVPFKTPAPFNLRRQESSPNLQEARGCGAEDRSLRTLMP